MTTGQVNRHNQQVTALIAATAARNALTNNRPPVPGKDTPK